MGAEKYEGRTRAERRHTDWSKAIRKKKLSDRWLAIGDTVYPYYDNIHQYSKNKIHCSCPLCRAKTKNKGKRSSYAPSYNPKMSEKKSNDSMNEQLEQLGEVGNG